CSSIVMLMLSWKGESNPSSTLPHCRGFSRLLVISALIRSLITNIIITLILEQTLYNFDLLKNTIGLIHKPIVFLLFLFFQCDSGIFLFPITVIFNFYLVSYIFFFIKNFTKFYIIFNRVSI